MKRTNTHTVLCLKHNINETDFDKIIHKVMNYVPADALSEKERDILFDLFDAGDVADAKIRDMLNLEFKAFNIFAAQTKCKDCILSGVCKNPDNEVATCCVSMMDFAQTVRLTEHLSFTDNKEALLECFKKSLKDYKKLVMATSKKLSE